MCSYDVGTGKSKQQISPFHFFPDRFHIEPDDVGVFVTGLVFVCLGLIDFFLQLHLNFHQKGLLCTSKIYQH